MTRSRHWSLLALASLSCGVPLGSSGRTLLIGVVIDRSGIDSEPSWFDAIKLARQDVNDGVTQAGLGVPTFEVRVADSANAPTVALAHSVDMVKNQGARALILDTSQSDLAVQKTFYDADPTNDLNVPIVCGSCTSGSLNNPAAVDPDPVTQAALRNTAGWNFRSVMSTGLISQTLVGLMLNAAPGGDLNGDGVFKVSFYGSDEPFGRGAAKDLQRFLLQLHPDPPPVLVSLFHPAAADPNSYDWDGDLKTLTSGAPDFIAVANFALQQAATRKAYVQGGSTVAMLHYHSLRFASVLESLGSLAQGAEGVSHVLLDNGASGDVFRSEYTALYGVDVVYRDANYYDAAVTLMLATAIASVGMADPYAVTGAQIRDALRRTSDPQGAPIGTGRDEMAKAARLIAQGQPINYEGASGPMDFDANGNVVDRLAHFQAQSGQFADLTHFDCVADPSCPVAN